MAGLLVALVFWAVIVAWFGRWAWRYSQPASHSDQG
jgi:hypothetical protein